MLISNPVERQVKILAPGVTARTFWGEKLMLVTVDFEPNSSVPIHKHPHEQSGMVISGTLEFIIGNERRVLAPGALYFIPGNVEHGAISGAEPTQVLDIFTPVREEFKY
jgi:quercetin dioxygenase-like cupin family protein